MSRRIPSLLCLLAVSGVARAEDQALLGSTQHLEPTTIIRVDVLDPNEQIRMVGHITDPVGGGSIPMDFTLLDPSGALLGIFPSGSQVLSGTVGAFSILPVPLDPDGDLNFELIEDWEFTAVSPAMTDIPGRVWSTVWRIDAGGFGSGAATDGSFYAVVDGGSLGSQGVVELKADGLAGFAYSLRANDLGVVGADGRSVPTSPPRIVPSTLSIYLLPPDPAVVTYDWLTPVLTNTTLTPESACGAVAPGIEGAGAVLEFESTVEGRVHLICDLNDDGIYDLTNDVDFHLLADAVIGANSFVWDGTDNLDVAVSPGTYDCVLKLTVGEFHFVASDIETSYEGFRLFEVDAGGARSGLPMFWNDAEVQANAVLMPNLEYGLETSGPDGLFSGAYAAATLPNVNARSWGAFQQDSKGNNAYLDTYTWLGEDQSAPFQVDIRDSSADTDGDLLVDAAEECVHFTDPLEVDSDFDGAGDYAEVMVTASDPTDPDSDDDGLLDGQEMADPMVPQDSDGDGLEDAVDPDDDDDGVLTVLEGATDADGDGTPNHLDDDDDDDGVLTADEDRNGNGDWFDDNLDGDGLPDFLDPDDDGDGVSDEDPGTDTDGDGIADPLDDDDDGDGVPTVEEWDFDGDGVPDDQDGDGVPNYLDDDDDGDGLPTLDEVTNGAPGVTDADGDGLPDYLDDDADGDTVRDGDDGLADVDGDGLPGFQDPDDDGDGIPTADDEGLTPDGDPTNDDTDGDGIPNFQDDDDDGDSVPTLDEWDRDGDLIPDDFDEDGIPNHLDPDDDNDGIPTIEEGDGDTDGDGLPDYLDPDADNDTILDRDEGTRDSDGDFTPDFQDADDDGDGVSTWEELGEAAGIPGSLLNTAQLDQAPDTDGDRDPDYLDPDDDDDGIPTAIEGGFDDDFDGDGTPNHHDLDSDDDGLQDEDEGSGDRDGDGDGNFVDLDSDGDGFADADEGDVDSDGDGDPDFLDDDDDDDSVRSIDEVDGDTDGDGTPDRLDTDDDGDGIDTHVEADDALVFGDDPDEDGVPSWVDTDSDGDGIDDSEEGTEDFDGDDVPNYLDPDGGYVSWYRGSGLSLACSATGASPAGGLGGLGLVLGLVFVRRRRGEESP